MKTAGFSPVVLHTGEGGSVFPVQRGKGLINTTTMCGDTLDLAPSSLDAFAHTPAWEKGCEWEEVSLKSCFSLACQALQGACVLLPAPFRVVVIDCSVAWCLLAAAASCAVSVATRCWCLDQQEGTFCHRSAGPHVPLLHPSWKPISFPSRASVPASLPYVEPGSWTTGLRGQGRGSACSGTLAQLDRLVPSASGQRPWLCF